MKVAYQAIFEPGETRGITIVSFPDLPEAHTQGETRDDIIFNAVEVLDLVLECRLEDGREIPTPQEHSGGVWVYPSAPVQAAILLRKARGGRSLSELARALETSWTSAQRLEAPTGSASLKRIERAAAILGYRLIVSLEPTGDSTEIEQGAVANL
ncbi:MAG: type II toxin-antitoxin system HicB family antitoxin [Syntrophobacteraceae bacterium]